jgi:Lysyl oxidase
MRIFAERWLIVPVLIGGFVGCRSLDTPGPKMEMTKRGEVREKPGVALVDQAAATSTDPGALIRVTMDSKVGVLLDEVPESMRDRVAAQYLEKPDAFWIERAKSQIELTTYKLVFRKAFYDKYKQQLPLPPANVQEITLTTRPTRSRTRTHDTIIVDFKLNTVIVTTANFPAESEPNLATAGGIWKEPFILPVDPEMVMQRTGRACLDEAEFPAGSLDSEDVAIYYDGECLVEKEPTKTGCHLTTPLPTKSCKSALHDHVGLVNTDLVYTRLKWDEQLAAKYTTAPLETTGGANLKEMKEGLDQNRVVYKYINSGSCEIEERCVGGTGWRRLMRFAVVEHNVGDKPVDVGAIDYYLTGNGPTLNDLNHIFEFSQCHQHYHFSHFVNYGFTGVDNSATKRGFCLESTIRLSNDRRSPLNNPYDTCTYQGVEVGWADQYNGGIPCQWVDTTDVDTKAGSVNHQLVTQANPDGFLCEGQPVLDDSGNQVYEPTSFKTANGETVNRAKCNFIAGWDSNNAQKLDVKVPSWGDGLITESCKRGQVGALRNCGMSNTKKVLGCTPGRASKLTCSIPAGAAPQFVRACPFSAKQGAGIACLFEESVANGNVEKKATLDFVCPQSLGADEPGGKVAIYSGAIATTDKLAAVSCSVQ